MYGQETKEDPDEDKTSFESRGLKKNIADI